MRRAAAAVLLGLAMAASHCGARQELPPADPQARLLLIGIDGAAWDEMLPLMQRGELPNLAALAREGYSAHLTTMAPALSPVVWTTVATGKIPRKHGIRGFLAVDPATGEGVPVTSNMRRASALWTILGLAGVKVGAVGWWVTWPAEEVNGWMVSPYAAPGQTTWKGTVYADGREDQTWPRGYLGEIAPEIEAGVDESRETFRRLFPVPEGMELPDYLQAFLKDTLWVHVSDTIFRNVGEMILAQEKPRFMAVYLGGVDVTGHRFWRFAHPDQGDWEVTDRQREIFGPALADYYRWTDAAVGRLVSAAGVGTSVLVVSDHGMEAIAGKDRPPTDWNQYPHEISGGHVAGPPGILLFSGPGAANNFDPDWWAGGESLPRLGGARHPAVVDIAPSVLHLFGLPAGRDMDGRVLTALFAAPLAARSSQFIDSWDDLAPLPDPTPIASPRMEEVKDRLRGLGYIE
jgi:predicted AlkP superfamily phosphohydrolase/phosphomutase